MNVIEADDNDLILVPKPSIDNHEGKQKTSPPQEFLVKAKATDSEVEE